MEYVPGITLEDLLARTADVAARASRRLLGCFCHALQAAHDAGIIHRDLKPANLMVLNAGTPDESLKVMDFGFAGFSAKPHIQLSRTHRPRSDLYAIGTPGYVSPEMIRGDRVDGRSDLYSVGIILYEMLTGRLPFRVSTRTGCSRRTSRSRRRGSARSAAGTSRRRSRRVVQLAALKYPNERQQTARELARSSAGARRGYWEATDARRGGSRNRVPRRGCRRTDSRHASGEPFHVTHEFEAYMPERLAAAKIRGFVEDRRGGDGERAGRDPHAARRARGLQEAKEGSGIFGWFGARGPRCRAGRSRSRWNCRWRSPTRASRGCAWWPRSARSKDYLPATRGTGTTAATNCTWPCGSTWASKEGEQERREKRQDQEVSTDVSLLSSLLSSPPIISV